MVNTDSMVVSDILAYVEKANDLQLQQIMDAVKRRYAAAYPQWDVFYAAIHKDPALRKKELKELVAYIEKDLKWHEQKRKTPSCEGV